MYYAQYRIYWDDRYLQITQHLYFQCNASYYKKRENGGKWIPWQIALKSYRPFIYNKHRGFALFKLLIWTAYIKNSIQYIHLIVKVYSINSEENKNQQILILIIYTFVFSYANSIIIQKPNNPCFVKFYFSYPVNGISKLLSTL